MAEFRSIHCKTWRDDWFSELQTDEKLLWLYLITNQATSVSGIYQLPIKFIAFETGLDKIRVEQILDRFKSDGKIDFDNSVIWIKKMREYQSSGSEKVHTRIMTDFNSLPDCRVKGIYAQKYGIDTAVTSVSFHVKSVHVCWAVEAATDPQDPSNAETTVSPASLGIALRNESRHPVTDWAMIIVASTTLRTIVRNLQCGLSAPRRAACRLL